MKRYLLVLGITASVLVLAVTDRSVHAAAIAAVDTSGSVLRDGDLISANVSAGDPDIFIIKLLVGNPELRLPDTNGYKRLFLSPAIFTMYGHLGGFSRVRHVSAGVRDSFETTAYFRNCETDDRRVWGVEVTGEDDGILHHVEISGDAAVSEDRYFFSKVFCINTREDNFYAKSIHPYTRLADVPLYHRRVCMQRPACLDSEPRCLMPEPAEGWCPSGCYYQKVQCVRTPCDPVLVCPTHSPTPTNGPCYVGGCSSQLCTDRPDAVSTCEYRAEYACYRYARCERQSNGSCGWTATDQSSRCIANPAPYQP